MYRVCHAMSALSPEVAGLQSHIYIHVALMKPQTTQCTYHTMVYVSHCRKLSNATSS